MRDSFSTGRRFNTSLKTIFFCFVEFLLHSIGGFLTSVFASLAAGVDKLSRARGVDART